ncbi:hypothetical protein EC988_006149, partial [Linderina pennispora]
MTLRMLREMVFQRLSQGFQFIAAGNTAGTALDNMTSSRFKLEARKDKADRTSLSDSTYMSTSAALPGLMSYPG